MYLRAACAAVVVEAAAGVAEEVAAVAAEEEVAAEAGGPSVVAEVEDGRSAAAGGRRIVEVQRAERLPTHPCNRGLRRRGRKLQDLRLQDHKPQGRHRLPVHPAFNNHRDRPIRRPEINCAQDNPARQPGNLFSDPAEWLKAGLRLERDPVKAAQANEFNLERDRVRAAQDKRVFGRVRAERVPGLDPARVAPANGFGRERGLGKAAPVSADNLIVSATTGVKTTGTITAISSIVGPTIISTAAGAVTVDGAAEPGGVRRRGAA